MGLSPEDIANAILGANVAQQQPRLRVPGNLVDVIQAVSRETGVPFHIIAGVVQTNVTTGTSGDWPVGVTPDLIAQVAGALVDARFSPYSDWRVTARSVFGASRPSWLDRFDSIVFARGKDGQPDISRPEWMEREPSVLAPDATKITVPRIGTFGGYTIDLKGKDRNLTRADLAEALRKGLISPQQYRDGLIAQGWTEEEADLVTLLDAPSGAAGVDIEDVRTYSERILGRALGDDEAQQYVGMSPAALRASLIASPEAASWRQFGQQIGDARRWVDSIWMRTYGRAPTNDEVLGVIRGGYTPERLEQKIRSEVVGGTTRGALSDARATANKYAQDFLGRDADEAELNFILTSLGKGKPTAKDIEAFYEQAKQRIDTGDPAFQWMAAPDAWRAARQTLQQVWARSGLVGEVDPRLVNTALTSKWTADDMQDYVNTLPAPGFASNISVGEVGRVRKIAGDWKAHYLPGQALTKEEMGLFVNMSSDQVRLYYRSLPVQMRRDALRSQPTGQTADTAAPPASAAQQQAAPTATGYAPSTQPLSPLGERYAKSPGFTPKEQQEREQAVRGLSEAQIREGTSAGRL